MNKRFLLSTVFILMSCQGLFAGAPEFSGEPEVLVKPKVSTTAQSQGPLLGQMIPDTMRRILAHLSFTDGWVLLSSVDKTHRHRIDVWTVFADVHGGSVTDGMTTAEEIRKKIMKQSKKALRAAIPSGEASIIPTVTERVFRTPFEKSFEPVLMANLLQSAQEKPFLWDILITTLRERQESLRELSLSEWQNEMNSNAYCGVEVFKNAPETSRRAYLVAVSLFKNLDGSPGVGAENAQKKLNDAVHLKRLGFTKDRGFSTSAYDYWMRVAARKNLDGTPGVGAENAQMKLNFAALNGEVGFTKDCGTETSGYDYLVAVSNRVNLDGSPGLGAEQALSYLAEFFSE